MGDNVLGRATKALNNILGGNNSNTVSTNILSTQLKSSYSEEHKSAANSPGGGFPVLGTDSLFNPFYIFRYSKFGDGPDKYDKSKHRDIKSSPKSDWKYEQESPSASKIIDWSKTTSSNTTGLGGTPYQTNDFLWCKHYGKVPNNKLLTLRRYQVPVEDNISVHSSKMPMVPIAQAVTWWGGDTGNTLDNVLGMTFGYKWESINTKVSDVQGNEVKLDSALDYLGLTASKNPKIHAILKLLFTDSSTNTYAMNDFDEKIKKWIKESYGSEGQYWNKHLGPINVIDSTNIRKPGFDFNHDIKLTFEYSLRSYNNINPRVAMLDLLSNFMGLTYSSAEFFGGGARYFQQTGAILPGLPTQSFEKGDYIKGTQEVITFLMAMVQGQVGDLGKVIKDIGKGITDFSDDQFNSILKKLEASNAAKNFAGSRASELMQTPLTMRSFLDGRAVGEWHITVGNPMNPIAVIGNLCLKNTKISFSDDVGFDDFPNSMKFEVTLTPGRPRSKVDIESMFNLGGGNMMWSPLPAPSSDFETYGEQNSIRTNDLNSNPATVKTKAQMEAETGSGPMMTAPIKSAAENYADYFKSKVKSAYGEGFGNSPILVNYFTQLKTKD